MPHTQQTWEPKPRDELPNLTQNCMWPLVSFLLPTGNINQVLGGGLARHMHLLQMSLDRQ